MPGVVEGYFSISYYFRGAFFNKGVSLLEIGLQVPSHKGHFVLTEGTRQVASSLKTSDVALKWYASALHGMPLPR